MTVYFMQHKLKMLFLVGALVMLTLSSGALHANSDAPEAAAATEARPYKATTVDECIREKACVWYAFSHAVVPKILGEKRDDVIWKWNKNVTVGVLQADSAGVFQGEVQGAIDQIQPYFPYDYSIKISKQLDVVVLLSNSFAEDIKKYEWLFDQVFGLNAISEFYRKIGAPEGSCLSLSVGDETQNVKKILVLISNSSSTAISCIQFSMYEILGFGKLHDFPFSVMDSKNDTRITELDLLLLDILYQPEFTSDMPLQQIETVFDQLYPKVLERFLLQLDEENKDD